MGAQGRPASLSQGYHGRMALHEMLTSNDAVREGIRHRVCTALPHSAARVVGRGMLQQDGIGKALQGLTDVAEMLAPSIE